MPCIYTTTKRRKKKRQHYPRKTIGRAERMFGGCTMVFGFLVGACQKRWNAVGMHVGKISWFFGFLVECVFSIYMENIK